MLLYEQTVFQDVAQRAAAVNAKPAQNIEGAKGADIYWLDQVGFRSTDYGGRSFAPRGETSVRKVSALG